LSPSASSHSQAYHTPDTSFCPHVLKFNAAVQNSKSKHHTSKSSRKVKNEQSGVNEFKVRHLKTQRKWKEKW